MISWETLVFFPQSATKYLAIQDVIKKKKKTRHKVKEKIENNMSLHTKVCNMLTGKSRYLNHIYCFLLYF